MKNFVVLSLLVVGGMAWWRARKNGGGGGGGLGTSGGPGLDYGGGSSSLGVSIYDTTAAANKPNQVLAALSTNRDAVSDPGYAPAFGPYENQPDDIEVWS